MVEKSLTNEGFVVIGGQSGHTVIPKSSLLMRLNYFDGKFLRAPDLRLEQQALLTEVRLSNRAGGWGIVHGYDCTLLGGDQLAVGGGLAIDPLGRVLDLPDQITVGIAELIEKSRSQTSLVLEAKSGASGASPAFGECESVTGELPGAVLEESDLYLITVGYNEAKCGEEDVYGKLCEEACISSTERPYIIPGVTIRAKPLPLFTFMPDPAPIKPSSRNLRSRVASAYFEQERQTPASLITDTGVRSSIQWCLGAEAGGREEDIPIAVLGRSGGKTIFLDAWIARRERIDAPARSHWAGRMAMRPWAVFLAQILQFQCHLTACFGAKGLEISNLDPCDEERRLAAEAAEAMDVLIKQYETTSKKFIQVEKLTAAPSMFKEVELVGGIAAILDTQKKLSDVSKLVLPNRLLISCGILELPSAGYLPVQKSAAVTVNDQVRLMMGEGVDLRFCVVRPDYVPHALEEAQHMERISLTQGLRDTTDKPHVDVLVPDGRIEEYKEEAPGRGYEMELQLDAEALRFGWPSKKQFPKFVKANFQEPDVARNVDIQRLGYTPASLPEIRGAARGETLTTGGFAFYFAGESQGLMGPSLPKVRDPKDVLKFFKSLSEDLPLGVIEPTAADTNETARYAELSEIRPNLGRFANAVSVSEGSVNILKLPSAEFWASLQIDRDPLAMSRGESTQVQARMILIARTGSGDSSHIEWHERFVSGQLRVEEIIAQGPNAKIECRLKAKGSLKWISTSSTGNPTRDEPLTLFETVFVSRTAAGGAEPTITVSISNPSFWAGLSNAQLYFQRIWTSADKASIRAWLRFHPPQLEGLSGQIPEKFPGRIASADALNVMMTEKVLPPGHAREKEVTLFNGSQKESAEVLKPGNDWHSASLSAANRIEGATEEEGFADEAERHLFPPPKPVPTELRVFARHDWVLFHRHRDISCGFDRLPEAQIGPRSYRVYHIHLPAEVAISTLIATLEADSSGAIASFERNTVTTVLYEPGIQALRTSHRDIRDDWEATVKVDANVHLGVIASRGVAFDEGGPLAMARLRSLTSVLGPVSESAKTLQLLTLDQMPETLAAGEVDGVIVYFTRAVATVCHDVYRFLTQNFGTFQEDLAAYLKEPGNLSIYRFLQRQKMDLLAKSPRFRDGTDELFGENEAGELEAAWRLVDDGPVSRALVIASEGEGGNQPSVTQKQASRIVSVMGSQIDAGEVIHQGVRDGLLNRCQAISVLAAEISCNDVYFTVADSQYNPEAWESAIKQFTLLIEKYGLQALLGSNKVFKPFEKVDFYRDTNQFEPSSREAYSSAWNAKLVGTPPECLDAYVISVAQGSDNKAETVKHSQLAKQQSESIRDLMGLCHREITASVHGGKESNVKLAFPRSCAAVTLVLVSGAAQVAKLPVMVAADPDKVGEGGAESHLISESLEFDDTESPTEGVVLSKMIERLRTEERTLNTLEVVSFEAPETGATDAKAVALLAALKEAGVASADAKVIYRIADEGERAEILRGGNLSGKGFVLR